MELKGKKINFLGDSITEGVGPSCRENTYLYVLQRNEGLAEARNYGISATRIARQSNYLTENLPAYVDRFDKMDDDADVIVVFGGTNDYGHGDAPIGEASDFCPTTFYGALNMLIDGLYNKYPKATIVFMTPLQRGDSPNPSCEGKSLCGKMLVDYVNIIKERCAYYSIPVLDLFTMSGIHPAIEISKETNCPDGLHPNDAGNVIIARLLANFLKTL